MEENEITSPFVEDATTPDTGSTQPTAPAPKRKNWFRRHTKLCVAVVILAVVAAVVGSQLRKAKRPQALRQTISMCAPRP